jgi:predicted DNA-binding protein
MQLIIELDVETARQLNVIQQHTNQDDATIVRQAIGLYHQQLQPHRQFYVETNRQSDLACNIPVGTNSN